MKFRNRRYRSFKHKGIRFSKLMEKYAFSIHYDGIGSYRLAFKFKIIGRRMGEYGTSKIESHNRIYHGFNI